MNLFENLNKFKSMLDDNTCEICGKRLADNGECPVCNNYPDVEESDIYEEDLNVTNVTSKNVRKYINDIIDILSDLKNINLIPKHVNNIISKMYECSLEIKELFNVDLDIENESIYKNPEEAFDGPGTYIVKEPENSITWSFDVNSKEEYDDYVKTQIVSNSKIYKKSFYGRGDF